MSLVFANDKQIRLKKLLDTKKYIVDLDYQREPDAWSNEDEQFFVDSLLKKIKIPKIYLHKKRTKHYIIDGQQRIETIRYFINGRKEKHNRLFLKLGNNITGRKKDVWFKDLKKNEKRDLLNSRITASIITKGSDNDIRDLFRRLQRGKPLTEGEKLNAMRGSIVSLMRRITDHAFFEKSLSSNDKRHKFYHIAATFLYIEHSVDDTKFNNIQKFFDRFESLSSNDKIYKNCIRNLNFLSKCYKDNEIPTSNLGWLTTIYLFVSEIRTKYGLLGKCSYSDIKDYLESFYSMVYDEEKRKGDYKKFYDMIHAATNTKSNIIGRTKILTKYFVDSFNVHLKDEHRLYGSTKARKIVHIRANGKCQYKNCQEKYKTIKFKDKFEIHHKKMHATGSKTNFRNAMLVHPECHRTIHKNMKLSRIKD